MYNFIDFIYQSNFNNTNIQEFIKLYKEDYNEYETSSTENLLPYLFYQLIFNNKTVEIFSDSLIDFGENLTKSFEKFMTLLRDRFIDKFKLILTRLKNNTYNIRYIDLVDDNNSKIYKLTIRSLLFEQDYFRGKRIDYVIFDKRFIKVQSSIEKIGKSIEDLQVTKTKIYKITQ